MAKLTAYVRLFSDDGMELTFETTEFSFEQTNDVIDVTREGDTAVRRQLGERSCFALKTSFPRAALPRWRKTNTAPDADGEE